MSDKSPKMSHLAAFRAGWESENLAAYILSRFSFVAHPATVSDDIGSDFYCTTFEPRAQKSHRYLVPRKSFAIQIKSDDRRIDVTNKIDYLWNLEIPYMVGVVDRKNLRLTVYSGEHLAKFLAMVGRPEALTLQPCARPAELDAPYYTESAPRHCTLMFPYLTEFDAGMSVEDVDQRAKLLRQALAEIHDNAATRHKEEHIYERRQGEMTVVEIIAGSGSAQHFRRNFDKRLAEVFTNFEWLHDHGAAEEIRAEAQPYLDLVDTLRAQRALEPYVIERRVALEKKLAASAKATGREPR